MASEFQRGVTIGELRSRFAAGRLTAERVLRDCFSRIRFRDAEVKAWEHLAPDQALTAARAIDRGGYDRPLAGIPIGIKDIIDTFDMPTTYGSSLYAGHRPETDAHIVARLRKQGAIVLGKTVSTEFAYLRPSRTRNPHDLRRTPGGSSSGSAAAVADCMVPVAIGTQTAGSTIRPAAFCGVVGFKPSYGLIDMVGVRPLAPSLDTIGIFSRDIDDARIVFEALASARTGFAPSQSTPRILVGELPGLGETYPAAFDVLTSVKAKLTLFGCAWEPLDLTNCYDGWSRSQYTLLAYEAYAHYAALASRHAQGVGSELGALVQAGTKIDRLAYEDAQAECDVHRVQFDQVLADDSILLMPAAPGEAPLFERGTGDPVFNSAWTMLHVPCLTFPLMRAQGGLPLGLQLIARRGNDSAMLAHARLLEKILSSSDAVRHA
jgi:amidase